MAKFECVFPSGYSFNDILQYFHTHLTKNHGECTGSSDYSSERARVAVRVYERYSLKMCIRDSPSGRKTHAPALPSCLLLRRTQPVSWSASVLIQSIVSSTPAISAYWWDAPGTTDKNSLPSRPASIMVRVRR